MNNQKDNMKSNSQYNLIQADNAAGDDQNLLEHGQEDQKYQ